MRPPLAILSLLIAAGSAIAPVRLASQQAPDSIQNQCFAAPDPAACELKAGIQSYKNARYEQAVEHFARAAQWDPKSTKAHLYLGTALAQQYIPGVDTPDNKRLGEQAIAQFSLVLRDAQDRADKLNAANSIASLNLYMKKFDDAKEYYRKVIDIDPQKADAYYGIAVVDWTLSYSARMKAYAKLGIKPELEKLDAVTCQELAGAHMHEVEEGMNMLVQALELRPDYDDAMAYMNLLFRERAGLRCSDPDGRKTDLLEADKWVDATLAAKKQKAEKAQRTCGEEAKENEPCAVR